MVNFLKKHSAKVVIFVVNGLLVTTGVAAISNNRQEKKDQMAIEGQSANSADSAAVTPAVPIENVAVDTVAPSTENVATTTTVQAADQPESSSAPTQIVPAKATAPAPIVKPAEPAKKVAKKSTKSKKSTSEKSTDTKTADSPAPDPKPEPKPAPAAETKTS